MKSNNLLKEANEILQTLTTINSTVQDLIMQKNIENIQKRFFWIAAIAVSLTGCASVTPNVIQIDERVFQLGTTVYGGFGMVDRSKAGVERATIKAAAQTALDLGCSFLPQLKMICKVLVKLRHLLLMKSLLG